MDAVAASASPVREHAVRTGARPIVRVTLRRAVGRAVLLVIAVCDLIATGWFGTGERVTMLARSLAFPGIGFVEWQPLLASFTIMAGVGAMIAWLRWGADWLLLALWLGAAAVTWFVVPLHHDVPAAGVDGVRILRASHEFAVVLVLMAVVGRARVAWASSWPGSSARAARRSGGASATSSTVLQASVVDRTRAAAIVALTDVDRPAAGEVLGSADVLRRAGRIGRVARLRVGGDPLRADQAAARAGLALAGGLTPPRLAAFRDESRRRMTGVPASEPTWVRPLDGTLAALALEQLGEHECVERWRRTFDRHFGLRHGRRRGALHTPSMLTIGTATSWEHAASSVLARRAGWIGDEDWPHLRRRCLGAAARGAHSAEDARLVAAGRLWARLVGDGEAVRILGRPSELGDALARALDALVDGSADGTGEGPPTP